MFAYPNDCRKYYICMNGLAYLNQCPDNYYWSQLTYRCDYRQYSSCGTTDFPDSSQAVRYSAYPGDCTRYYETRTLRCPHNYHWNEHYERCDLPQFAGCSGYPVTLPPSSSPAPLVPTAATAPPTSQPITQPDYNKPFDPEYLCKNSVNMPYLPYPGDCQKFIYCGPTPSVLTCPTGLYWNRNTQSCGSTNVGCTM